MIELKAAIPKSKIEFFGELKGKANSGQIKIEEASFPSGSLCFQGFSGMLNLEAKLYEGVMKFEPVKPPNPSLPSCDFSEILNAIVSAPSSLPLFATEIEEETQVALEIEGTETDPLVEED